MFLSAKHALYVSCACGIVLRLFWGLSGWQCLLIAFLGFLGLGGLRPSVIFFKTLPRDVQLATTIIKVIIAVRKNAKNNGKITDRFREVVARHPDKTAILFEEQKWTFQDLEDYSNRVAHLLTSKGLKRGNCIALFMTNCPQYVGILIGAAKIGVEVALINYNLRDKGLFHCISIAECSGIIFENTLEEAVDSIYDQLDEQFQELCFSCLGVPKKVGRSFDDEVSKQSEEPLPPLTEQRNSDVLCYIYTSGTTGLPKAVPIKHQRFFAIVTLFKNTVPFTSDDVIYDCLPLYHTNGGVIVMGQCFVNGITVALRKKFSASQFIKDCIKYKCTAFSYIGEVCRYILLQPPADTDTQHSLVKCTGNGLRQEIWKDFQKRFAIPKIVEFYGSTEGTFALINMEGKAGAIGYLSPWVKALMKVSFIKVDPTNGDIIRGSNGFCSEVPVGEQGEMVRIVEQHNPESKFDGYKDKAATSKKILKDVFKKGDSYFRTGDVARMDEEGYIYFCDRAGDTFRWKGENVSTTEVENTISSLIGQTDVVVYGVEVPKTEGRAGMAAIVGTAESIDITQLANQLKKTLPAYAVPVFIRLIDSSRTTGTFKFQKVDYRKEGFDSSKVSDPLFVLDPSQKTHVPLTTELYEKIENGGLRL